MKAADSSACAWWSTLNKKVFTCSISRSSCWMISSNNAWKRFCKRRVKKQVCSSECAEHHTIVLYMCVCLGCLCQYYFTLTERPLGMPVRGSWPFHGDCDNDWRWGFDGPKAHGNESFKWQPKKGHVCSISTHCKVSTRVLSTTITFHVSNAYTAEVWWEKCNI